jgi:hypothetical protein
MISIQLDGTDCILRTIRRGQVATFENDGLFTGPVPEDGLLLESSLDQFFIPKAALEKAVGRYRSTFVESGGFALRRVMAGELLAREPGRRRLPAEVSGVEMETMKRSFLFPDKVLRSLLQDLEKPELRQMAGRAPQFDIPHRRLEAELKTSSRSRSR